MDSATRGRIGTVVFWQKNGGQKDKIGVGGMWTFFGDARAACTAAHNPNEKNPARLDGRTGWELTLAWRNTVALAAAAKQREETKTAEKGGGGLGDGGEAEIINGNPLAGTACSSIRAEKNHIDLVSRNKIASDRSGEGDGLPRAAIRVNSGWVRA